MPRMTMRPDAPLCVCGCGRRVGWCRRRGFGKYASRECYHRRGRDEVCRSCGTPRTVSGPRLRCKVSIQVRNRMKKYGMTFEEALAIPDVCELCWAEGALGVDHDHETGLRRGWLCRNCNAGLGMFEDNPDLLRAAIRYLKHWSQGEELVA